MINYQSHTHHANVRARGMALLMRGLPAESVAKLLGVTQCTTNKWRRHKIREQLRKLCASSTVRSRRAKFVDKHKPSNVNGPAMLVDGRYVREVLQ